MALIKSQIYNFLIYNLSLINKTTTSARTIYAPLLASIQRPAINLKLIGVLNPTAAAVNMLIFIDRYIYLFRNIFEIVTLLSKMVVKLKVPV